MVFVYMWVLPTALASDCVLLCRLHPLVLWGQTRDHIELKMELFECKDIQVDFGGNLQELHFKYSLQEHAVSVMGTVHALHNMCVP